MSEATSIAPEDGGVHADTAIYVLPAALSSWWILRHCSNVSADYYLSFSSAKQPKPFNGLKKTLANKCDRSRGWQPITFAQRGGHTKKCYPSKRKVQIVE